MASYHLSVKILSRSSGRSGVAAAAYRSRSQLVDKRQGLTFDYSGKADLSYNAILTPAGAPSWAKDRAELWNRVEAFEKRKDAQIMREVEVALPAELNEKEQVDLLNQFCQENFVSKGMVADICVHQHPKNPHAHIMLTMRKISADEFGKKERSWNRRDLIPAWRENWAELQNFHLSKAGYDITVDNRSNKARGIALLPQRKIGVAGYVSETDAQERTQKLYQVLKENGRRIIEHPEIALQVISYHHATFNGHAIYRFISSHTLDGEQFDAACKAVFKSSELVRLGEDESGQERYTTRTMLRSEREMLRSTEELNAINAHRVSKRYQKQAAASRTMSTDQKGAFDHVMNSGRISAVVGYAGTGKSYTLGAIREAYEAQGYKVQGMALSGIAAEGLQLQSGIESSTIHRKLLSWESGHELPDNKSVLIIDEAGMVGTRQMHQLVETAKGQGAKIVLVGDFDQLQPIEAGGAFRGICDRIGYHELSEIRRQKSAWQQEATRMLSGRPEQVAQALDRYDEEGHFKSFDDIKDARLRLLVDWKLDIDRPGEAIIVAYRNKDVNSLNMGARQMYKESGKLTGPEMRYQTKRGKVVLSAGDRIIFLKNEYSMQVKNGSLGTVQNVKENALLVQLDTGESVSFDTRQYDHFYYGYAATIHKTQGVTVDRSYVLATRHMDKHSAYVALSRHRDDVKLYWSKDKAGFKDFAHMKTLLSRERPKHLIHDYAKTRGVKIDLSKIYQCKYFKVTIDHDGIGQRYARNISTGPRLDHSEASRRVEKAAKTMALGFMKRHNVKTASQVVVKVERVESEMLRADDHQKRRPIERAHEHSTAKRAFKISVAIPGEDRTFEKIELVNQKERPEKVTTLIDQAAREYVVELAVRLKLKPEDIRRFIVDVVEVPLEMDMDEPKSKVSGLDLSKGV